MRGTCTTMPLKARFLSWFFHHLRPSVVNVEVYDLSCVDSEAMKFAFAPFTPAVASKTQCGFIVDTEAICESSLLPQALSEGLHGLLTELSVSPLSAMLYCEPLLVPKSTAQEVNLASIQSVSVNILVDVRIVQYDIASLPEHTRRSEIDVILPQHSLPITKTVNFSIPSASTVNVDLTSVMTTHEANAKVFGPVSTYPLPLHFSLSERTGLLAEIHNALLSRIGNGLQFVGEMDEGIEKFERLKKEIRLWAELFGDREAAQQIWEEFPGAVASFLVLAGIYEYSHGEYWNFVLPAIGIPNKPPYQRYWGKNFRLFICVFGLNLFEESGLRYVGPILGHTMVPNDCLPEFFEQLLEPTAHSLAWTGLSAYELIAKWLSRPASFAGVDRPVWQFLRHGGQVAGEFVSEATRMVRIRYETGLISDACDLKLPPRMVQQYKIWLALQPDPPAPRGPFLKLDPYSGILLAFPDQKLTAEYVGQICTWEVYVTGGRLRGPSDYAQKLGEGAVFRAPEISVPPDGPYTVQLVVNEETCSTWSLKGMSNQRPWKAFSGQNFKELDMSHTPRVDSLWFVIPENGTVVVRDLRGNDIVDAVRQPCPLFEYWMDYKAIEVSLSAAADVEVCCENFTELINIEQTENEVVFSGGDLLQAAQASFDNVELFGISPPQLRICTKPGTEEHCLANTRIRFSGCGTEGSFNNTPSILLAACQVGVGQIVFDLQKLIPLQLCPGDLTITLWYCGRRLATRRFRWVPGLHWEWNENGRAVTVYVPERTTLSEKWEDEISDLSISADNCVTVALHEKSDVIDLLLSWEKFGRPQFSFPLRLYGPRWAFLRKSSDTPIWQVAPMEILSEHLLKHDTPCIILEVRDRTWQEANLCARWIGTAHDNMIVDLGTDRLSKDRWLIRLAEITDTLRQFQNFDSEILVKGTIVGTFDTDAIPSFQLHVMRLPAPITFWWAFQPKVSSHSAWTEEYRDLDLEALIENPGSCLFFEIRGAHRVDAEVSAFWQPLNQPESYRMLSTEACAERDRWRIHLSPVVKFLEELPTKDSEVWIEIAGLEKDEKTEMALIRIHCQPATLRSYEECIHWAEGNRLRTLALDLLCDLQYKHWFLVDDLAIEWKASPELIRRAICTLRVECPAITVTERNRTFAMSRETFKQMKPILNRWYQSRWKEREIE